MNPTLQRTLRLIATRSLVFALPVIVFAAEDVAGLIKVVTDLVNPLIVLISSLALVVFLWGMVQYIASAGDESKKTEGRKIMTYGILGLFVIFGIWGILRILVETFFGTQPLSL